jgi:DNA polymerase III gamma/tau subunit
VPVTVLSRCQRFDLRRVDAACWCSICRHRRKEKIEVEPRRWR